MAILYFCSDGARVTQSTIERCYYNARVKKYSGLPTQRCHGCGGDPNGSAHTIAQARCKVIHKTELIWHPGNFWPACPECNRAIENPKGRSWRLLRNKDECLRFIEIHDPELYLKFMTA